MAFWVSAAGVALDGRLGVRVAGQSLDVNVVRGEMISRLGVLDAGGVREPLGECGLLAERLGERGVGQRAARV